jgi:hypothetical protein
MPAPGACYASKQKARGFFPVEGFSIRRTPGKDRALPYRRLRGRPLICLIAGVASATDMLAPLGGGINAKQPVLTAGSSACG